MSIIVERRNTARDLLHGLVSDGLVGLQKAFERADRTFPRFVTREAEGYLRCGHPWEGFAWLVCGDCDHHRSDPLQLQGTRLLSILWGRQMAHSRRHPGGDEGHPGGHRTVHPADFLKGFEGTLVTDGAYTSATRTESLVRAVYSSIIPSCELIGVAPLAYLRGVLGLLSDTKPTAVRDLAPLGWAERFGPNA